MKSYDVIWIITYITYNYCVPSLKSQIWCFFPHNLDIRWRRKIISSTFVDQTTFEKLGGEASTIIHSPSHSLRCRYWCYCDDESVYQRFCQGPLVSGLYVMGSDSSLWSLGCQTSCGCTFALLGHVWHLRPCQPLCRLELEITGDMRPWASNSDVQIGFR